LPFIQNILVADAKDYEHQLAENIAPLIAALSKPYDYVLMAANTMGKNILPRVAALLEVSMVSDVIQILSPDTFVRPIYAGNALATVQLSERIKLLTIRTTAFSASLPEINSAVVEKIATLIPNTHTTFISSELTQSKRP